MDKAIVQTSEEWWFDRFWIEEKATKEKRLKTKFYPCRLIQALTQDGKKIVFPHSFKVNPDEWITRIDSEDQAKDPAMIFDEFYKLHQYVGNTQAKSPNGSPGQ